MALVKIAVFAMVMAVAFAAQDSLVEDFAPESVFVQETAFASEKNKIPSWVSTEEDLEQFLAAQQKKGTHVVRTNNGEMLLQEEGYVEELIEGAKKPLSKKRVAPLKKQYKKFSAEDRTCEVGMKVKGQKLSFIKGQCRAALRFCRIYERYGRNWKMPYFFKAARPHCQKVEKLHRHMWFAVRRAARKRRAAKKLKKSVVRKAVKKAKKKRKDMKKFVKNLFKKRSKKAIRKARKAKKAKKAKKKAAKKAKKKAAKKAAKKKLKHAAKKAAKKVKKMAKKMKRHSKRWLKRAAKHWKNAKRRLKAKAKAQGKTLRVQHTYSLKDAKAEKKKKEAKKKKKKAAEMDFVETSMFNF